MVFSVRRTATVLSAVMVSAAMLAAGGGPAAAAVPASPIFSPPKAYQLVLGDSLAFGQQSKRLGTELATGTYNPADFPGYTGPFASAIAAIRHQPQTVVNYGCPGETTASMIAGPCAFANQVHGMGYPQALHNDYAGSQLDAAVRFLARHHGRTSPVTVSIGANNLLALFNHCGADVACLQAGLPETVRAMAADLATILRRLRAAEPSVEIIVLTPYNPRYVLAPASDSQLAMADASIATVARAHRARVADGFAAVNLAIPGDELASVCTFTLICTDNDIHPSDSGYLKLAAAFWNVSGYAWFR